ncbi:MAG: MaoC/PaaZ C-terminal domain-containing protein [Byssovorax sp.]
MDQSTVGFTTQPHALAYDWRLLATYALGIGAKRDELAYLYENAKGGMKVYPTFAVVPSYTPVMELLAKCNANMAMVVHGAQLVRIHKQIPDSGTMQTTGTLKAIYDMKKFAQIILETNTSLHGEPVFDTQWSILVRGAGGFEGKRPPEAAPEPTVPKDRPADWTFEEATSPEQALLYRLCGDANPLHADPEFATAVGFPQGPILHGLATYGFAARALIKQAAGGDGARVRAFNGQFRKPVWPGDTLITQGWNLEEGKVAFNTTVKGRPEVVLGGGWAEIG